jgi:peptidoglycan/xylan/chitin deacetylase (PgdA/CDA1 family)
MHAVIFGRREVTGMRMCKLLILALAAAMGISWVAAQARRNAGEPLPGNHFEWPNGKRAAVSLSFDDSRLSQIDAGLAVLRKEGVKATFYVQAPGVEKRQEGWKTAVAEGHEIGNHTVTHPCTGNYPFSRYNALEDYDLKRMAQQMDENNQHIHKLLGVTPKDFAYPCGLKFVGRGRETKSYVPLVAERFLSGRGYLDEAPNDPSFVDLAQAMGTPFDDLTFEQMKKLVDEAVQNGSWIIFVGHEMGSRAYQTTDLHALEQLCEYLKDPANGIWLGTVEQIGRYVSQHQPGIRQRGR